MKRNNVGMVMAVLVVFFGTIQCDNNGTPALIKIYGSTTIEPFMKQATDAFGASKKILFSIKATGSQDGIDSLIAGTCDLAMSSIEISTDQIAEAKKQGVAILPFLLGFDVIVPVVHPSNMVSDITLDRLREIYAGTIYRWSAVGGADTTIDIVERAPSSGTYTVWHHDIVPHAAAEKVTVCTSNSEVLAYVARHNNAIGYISPAFLNPEVKPLRLDGLLITENDSLLSKYHLKRPLYLYGDANTLNSKMREFISFLIISKKGRDILEKAGYYSGFSPNQHFKATEKRPAIQF